MKIEIKKSRKPIKYSYAINFLEKRLVQLKNGKATELVWILEHPEIYTGGTSYKNYEIFNHKKLKFATKLKPSKRELKCAEFAMNVCKFVKSNSIVVTKDFSTIGIGAGQPSRVDSCKIAVEKARAFQPKKIRNSIAASDAFFPFPDGIRKLIKSGFRL